MAGTAGNSSPLAPHIPVMLDEVLATLAPIEAGIFIDGTFGAGGYSRALLEQGAAQVVAIDRDPSALAAGEALARDHDGRLVLVEGTFSDLGDIATQQAIGPISGIVLDIGVSSMQLDRAERGFSFLRDGPLDMRMGNAGPSAEDLVNRAGEAALADVIFHYGEDRAARRIARAIVAARVGGPILRTGELAEIVGSALPRPKPGQIHPATRTFQALRIAVNGELDQLVEALAAAEEALPDGARLVIVTFHSLEDRIVKRYFQIASGQGDQGSRHAPVQPAPPPRYSRPQRIAPSAAEVARNPRARSARLRAATRNAAAPAPVDAARLGLPSVPPISRLIAGAAAGGRR